MQVIDSILREEGGFVVDEGGPTNMGITQTTLDKCRQTVPSLPSDVRKLTRDDATLIYERWFSPQWASLPPGTLQHVIAHISVMSWDDGIRHLQKRLRVPVDGIMGTATAKAVANLRSNERVKLAIGVAMDFLTARESRKRYTERLLRVILEGLAIDGVN